MPICWSVVTTEVTAFARSAGVAGSAARVSFRYEPPPNMANRTLAATESWATGSPGCGFGVPAQTAWWTGAQAEHTFALAWADSWSLYECEAPGRSHAAMATAVAITAIAMATNATERGDVHQPTTGECFSLLSARRARPWALTASSLWGLPVDVTRTIHDRRVHEALRRTRSLSNEALTRIRPALAGRSNLVDRCG